MIEKQLKIAMKNFRKVFCKANDKINSGNLKEGAFIFGQALRHYEGIRDFAMILNREVQPEYFHGLNYLANKLGYEVTQ